MGLLAMICASPAAAQSAQTDGKAVVVQPLSLVKTADLDFGIIAPGLTGGDVVVQPDGTRTVSGDVTEAGGTVRNAEFLGYGYRGRIVTVTTAQASYTLTRVGGLETLLLTRLTLQADNLTPRFFPGQFTINSTDLIRLRIGGTLTVLPAQAGGVYKGSFPITMNYY